VILFLNKQDVLERKLQEGQRLEKFFEHFSPFDTKEETIEEYIDRARAYIRDLFLVNLFVCFFPETNTMSWNYRRQRAKNVFLLWIENSLWDLASCTPLPLETNLVSATGTIQRQWTRLMSGMFLMMFILWSFHGI
jgi:hypothetical protein